jgi:hypothetical protein
VNNDKIEFDECESVGAPMIRIKLTEFILAPEFQYLNDARMGESETSPIPEKDEPGPPKS